MCNVSAVVGVDAELDERSVNDVKETENAIVSQWGDVSANEQHVLRNRVNEILLPFGYETRLLVMRRANSIALYFICLTMSAVMSLRDQWRSPQQLRNIVQPLFTLLSGVTLPVRVKRLSWPLTDYERCLEVFSSVHGKQLAASIIAIILY